MLAGAGLPPAGQDRQIVKVTDEISGVVENTLFVCIKGEKTDGRRFAAQAFDRGAAAVVSETPVGVPAICTDNARLAFSRLCAAFYGRPDRKLALIGVTGTNGKTTTAAYIKSILERCGYKTALIGTLGSSDGGTLAETGYTTPKSDLFFKTLSAAAENGCACCVTEVSSQALAQYRVHGADFAVGALTNIGADHLDYHKTVENLVAAKTRLCALSRRFLVNADDAYAGDFLSAAGKKARTFSLPGDADFTARRVRALPDASVFDLCFQNDVSEIVTPLPGVFSVYNALAAASVCLTLGLPFERVAGAARSLPLLPGRMQTVYKNGVRVCIDFAHTPTALEAALKALRARPGGKLIAVFGCGGDRDKSKRPVMGALAAKYADTVVVTSDNPRTEDPDAIIREILSGVPASCRVHAQPDRKQAIALAMRLALPGDTVLLAGKGHETYQIVGDQKIPFSDLQTVVSS
ncbi:MAG: UDP-N-acetylmuramoyl-L-alanyl-D-glutamate--2,6-diaminopimelate ligase [Clostridia bacterium]|nr:UDP-N-acetylmuramoyl-L-alanyl-D-glutamate--2,6-diaminopimelate ligase [Clostridia bacterium]